MLQRFDSSPTMIERPRCPKCQICMMLVAVEPSFAGPDLQTFQCQICDLDYEALDPMKSSKVAGWIKSELRSPK